ncbi:MAG: LytTR family transcriptional regulator DNA-binding domain-containing protein [Oscillospiraceae bacterium]|nr:LytTR family transcriptional regulator DNA-binding domain-containing protein [Oscillospiraceae bacterium]
MVKTYIAMCDSDQSQLDTLELCVLGCNYWRDQNPTVTRFTSADELLEKIAVGVEFSCIFLAIQMIGSDGIETCRGIQKVSDASIIFVSSHVEYQSEIDELFPAMLLSRPYTSENLDNLLIAYAARIAGKHPLTYLLKGEVKKIPISAIVYLQASKGCVTAYLRGREIRIFDVPLAQISRDYAEQGLFRCHRSFIINLRYYAGSTYKNAQIRFRGEILQIPLSRKFASGDALRGIHRDFSGKSFGAG